MKLRSRIVGRRFLLCTCLRRTIYACFFDIDGQHGACSECGDLEAVEVSDGTMTYRMVCERCRHIYKNVLNRFAERSLRERARPLRRRF